ncbi:hypothetical protein ES705_02207 [subsurface metagenome]|nr:hypothetical protein [Clostridia bacterium]TET14041.1 MAG: hypothetical protein E3J77_05465 [Actinomycetota bacterium]
MDKHIYTSTITGINWSLTRVIVLIILKFVASIILAKLIVPADFGTIVIATILNTLNPVRRFADTCRRHNNAGILIFRDGL